MKPGKVFLLLLLVCIMSGNAFSQKTIVLKVPTLERDKISLILDNRILKEQDALGLKPDNLQLHLQVGTGISFLFLINSTEGLTPAKQFTIKVDTTFTIRNDSLTGTGLVLGNDFLLKIEKLNTTNDTVKVYSRITFDTTVVKLTPQTATNKVGIAFYDAMILNNDSTVSI